MRIDRLTLRVSGLGPEQARALGQTVANELARLQLPSGPDRKIKSMDLRVPVPGAGIQRTAHDIAQAVQRRLK